MPDRTHVLIDVTNAQEGRPSLGVAGFISQDEPITEDEALLLSDDLRRAALTARQLHEEFGDDRDPRRRPPPPGSGESF